MKIEVGKILKAQGVKGELKIGCYLDNAQMLKKVKELRIGANNYSVAKMRFDGTVCYAYLNGINDRNTAESMRDWTVYAEKDDLALAENRYFVSDLVGCRVTLDDGTYIGDVQDVLQYGAADVFVCKTDNKDVSFPFLNDLIVSVNIASKSIVLKVKRFNEVAVYED